MSHFDPELKDALDRRSEGVRVVADLAERAIARDRSNHRRELGAAVLGAGLVLAVALPVAWSSVRPADDHPLPVGPSQSTTLPTSRPSSPTGPSTTAPSATPTAIPTIRSTGAPDAAVLEPASGAVTATTDVGYAFDGVFHDGERRIALGDAFRRPDRVASLGNGLLVTAGDRAAVMDANGRTVRDLPALQGPIAVDADGRHALVTDRSGNLLYLDSTGREVGRVAASRAGHTGWQVTHLDTSTAYALNSEQTSTLAWDVASGRTTTIEGAVTLVDRAGARGLVVDRGITPDQPGFGCQRLVDLATRRTIWTLCGPLSFTSFSYTGAQLLGTGFSDGQPSELVNGTDGTPLYQQLVVVNVDDGKVVMQGGGDGSQATGWIQAARFGPYGAITAQVGTAGQQRNLQRCSVDGLCEVVGEAAPAWEPDIGPDSSGPYVLADN